MSMHIWTEVVKPSSIGTYRAPFIMNRAIFLVLISMLLACTSLAGPPFTTDDPEPVDFHHWEFYLASAQEFAPSNDVSATLPHIEINYGALPNLQLHIVAPMSYAHSLGMTEYGYGNTELGAKFRFVEETGHTPQIGVFPLVEIPTGSQAKGLSNGETQVFLPVWLQKSWGKFTTYGGGGFWYNPGDQMKNFGFVGWEAQYDLSDVVTLGGELYHQSPNAVGSDSPTRVAIGGYVNPTEHHHILFSFGKTFIGGTSLTGYLAYQITI